MDSKGQSVLTGISFENFCRFEKVTIDLHSESISLLGENGRGKTTVLKGIELFATLFGGHVADGGTPPYSFEINKQEISSLLGAEELDLLWYNRDTTKPIIIGGILSFLQDPDKEIKFTVRKGVGETKGAVLKVTCDKSRLELQEIEGPTVVSISNTGVFTPLQETEEFDIQSQIVYKICVDNRRHVRQLLEAKDQEAFKANKGVEISSLLERYGIREGCDVEFSFTKVSQELQIMVSEQGVGGKKGVKLPLSRCDAGLQQVIIIMLMVLYVQEKEGKKPRRRHLLLDEPVALFHGNLVRKLLEYLKQEGFCVILACHAVDTLLACNCIISLDGDNGPYIIPEEVRSELCTLFRGSNHTTRLMEFSKTLRTKCILIVEGEADAVVLKAWIKRLYGIDIEDKVGVYINRGRPNTSLVKKLVSCLDVSQFRPGGKHLKIFVLTDRDFRPKMFLDIEQQDVSDLNKEYAGQSISVKWHCYKRNEVENYLLSAAALKSCLDENSNRKKAKMEESVSKDAVQKRLADYIEEYFPFLQLMKSYSENAQSAHKKMPQGSKQKDILKNYSHEKEAKALMQQRDSFTDAKKVLKRFGISEKETDKYCRLVHHFPEEDIDTEIQDLTKDVLKFFKIPGAADLDDSPEDVTANTSTKSSSLREGVTSTTVAEESTIAPTTVGDTKVTLWKCPAAICMEADPEASIVIGIHLAQLVGQLSLDPTKELPPQWIALLRQAITDGNENYKFCCRNEPDITVKEAVDAAGARWEAREQMERLQIPKDIVKYLELNLKKNPNRAAFYTVAGKTVTCLRGNDGMIVIDTHYQDDGQLDNYVCVYYAAWNELQQMVKVVTHDQSSSLEGRLALIEKHSGS